MSKTLVRGGEGPGEGGGVRGKGLREGGGGALHCNSGLWPSPPTLVVYAN